MLKKTKIHTANYPDFFGKPYKAGGRGWAGWTFGSTGHPGGAEGAMAPPDFDRSVNPISTKEGRLCPPNNTPGFSDLPTALLNSARKQNIGHPFFDYYYIYWQL